MISYDALEFIRIVDYFVRSLSVYGFKFKFHFFCFHEMSTSNKQDLFVKMKQGENTVSRTGQFIIIK